MKIAHIITGLSIGGAERALQSLLAGGLNAQSGNLVISLTDEGYYGEQLRRAGIPVTCIGMKRGIPTPFSIWRLLKAVHRYQPELIQGWMYHGNIAASLAHSFAGRSCKLAWNVRRSREAALEMKRTTGFLVKLGGWLSANVDAVIYNSERSRAQHEAEGYAREHSHVIPNGFDINRWQPDPTAAERLRIAHDIAPQAALVGFVARAHPHKDPSNLFKAFIEVAKQNPACHLVCVGRGLAEAAPSHLNCNRVTFLGERSDVEQIMPAFDFLCLTSQVEGFPNVVGEAMACGVACVTTDVGDAGAIVGDTGWVVPPRDSEALATALLNALAVPEFERDRRRLAARTRVEQEYSLGSVLNRYIGLYESL